MPPETNFFYSNLFIAIVTLLVGAFGFILYHLRGRDLKRRTAKIILLEITSAEAQLKDARNRIDESESAGNKKLPEHLYVMPTDTWSSSKHLFIDDFKTNEWAAINEFYDKCQLFDEAIKHNDGRFSQEEQQIRMNAHRATYECAVKLFEKIDMETDEAKKKTAFNEFFTERDRLAEFLTTGSNIWIYTPSKQLANIESILSTISTEISLSSAGIKLDKLSKRKLMIAKR